MKYPGVDEGPSTGIILQLLRLVIVLFVGAGAGLAVFALTHYLMGGTPRTEDEAYALGSGTGCLVTGILLMVWPIQGLARWSAVLAALLLGTGVTFSILGFFWWMQRQIFVYSRHPELNYLLGEVGGYSGPGLGLLTCGIFLVLSFFVWPDKGRRSILGDGGNLSPTDTLQPERLHIPGFLFRLTLASILGAGAGLVSGAITYTHILLGTVGPTSVIAGFVAAGFGCFAAGVAFFFLCARTAGLSWLWRVGVALFLLTGLVICSMGVIQVID